MIVSNITKCDFFGLLSILGLTNNITVEIFVTRCFQEVAFDT